MSDQQGVTHKFTNRLAQSTSPYLLQHAHNPVDWQPWDAHALAASKAQNKPIFLSVGYSTCYWCHVMERECFENETIAKLMNELFICIKVDREERPDVDQVYMTAVQVITRQGGWPMSVFLTPELKPFFGGTYFPPADMSGRPGFPRVLTSIAGTFADKREQVERSADEIVKILQRVAHPSPLRDAMTLDMNRVESLIERSIVDYDACYGGFSGAPKFPRQTLLELVLRYITHPQATEDALAMKDQVLHTLDAMAQGGIRDQLAGGFHRYSTDERWLVPHFEIMLYDNAMLAVCYTLAWQISGKAEHAQVVRDICDFVLRDMMREDGAFFTAFDAEVDAQEGLTYLWTQDEVRDVLAARGLDVKDIDWFCRVHGLSQGPNFSDPHHGDGVPDKSILHVADPQGGRGGTSPLVDLELRAMREILLNVRRGRKQPMLDTKVLTSWNALMIRALAIAGKALDEPGYVAAAGRAAAVMLKNISGPLAPAFLDDCAFLAQAMLALQAATGENIWRDRAAQLVDVMQSRFGDAEAGGFYFTAADATDLIVRQKTANDSPLPSGNAVAAMVLTELGKLDQARDVMTLFAQSIEDQAEGMSSMVQAAMMYLETHEPFEAGAADEPAEIASPAAVAREVVGLSARFASATELRITIGIAAGYHINSSKAAQGMIPTTLTISPGDFMIEYPESQMKTFPFTTEPMEVYEGNIIIVARTNQALAKGAKLSINLTCQPCRDDACLAAMMRSLTVTAP